MLASAQQPRGPTAYVLAWEWGCGYKIGVSDGPHMIRGIAAIGPFPCDAPPPKVEWRGAEVVLIDEHGAVIASWPATE